MSSGEPKCVEECANGSLEDTSNGSSDESKGVEPSKTVEQSQPPLSKNQIKKRLKHEKWVQTRLERRRMEKEKRKRRVAELKAQGLPVTKRLKKRVVKEKLEASSNKTRIVIDLDFSEYQTDDDIKKLLKQIHRTYSTNRGFDQPCQLWLTSCHSRVRQKLDEFYHGWNNWDCNITEKSYKEMFLKDLALPLDKVVYLTADAEESLPSDIKSDPTIVYIIGGLVDHNHYPKLCYNLAKSAGIRVAKLPIFETGIKLCSRAVLAVNHVFEIMLYASVGTPWKECFQKVIPPRKIIQYNNESSSSPSKVAPTKESGSNDGIKGENQDTNEQLKDCGDSIGSAS